MACPNCNPPWRRGKFNEWVQAELNALYARTIFVKRVDGEDPHDTIRRLGRENPGKNIMVTEANGKRICMGGYGGS